MSKCWSVIQLEGYCLLGLDSRLQKCYYDLDGNKYINKEYDPSYTESPPEYCTNTPSYTCLANGCEFFAYCEFTGFDEDE